MPGMIEDTKFSSYLSSNKMIYIEVDLNWDGYICNQYDDEFKELTLNITDTISSESQLFQNGTSSINVTELKSCTHQNNILDQESNSLVYKNSDFDDEIPKLKSYPPNHIFQNKLCQISSLSHQKFVSDMKEVSRNKTKLLQNNIKAPTMDFGVTDNSNEECYQSKTVLRTDENDGKSVVLDISNKNVVGIKENLSDKYETTETNVEVISNKSSEKQKVSDISIPSSCINNNCFLSKEMIDIPFSQDSFSQDSFDDYSSLSSLSVNLTESDTSDLAEQFVNILKISDRKKIVEDEPWKHVEDEPWKHVEDFKEITLDDCNITKDDDFSDNCSLSQPLWNSRGLKHLQTPEIPEDNKNSLTPCKRPFDGGCKCNDSNPFKNSCCTSESSCSINSTHNILCNDPSQITSEKGKQIPPKKEKITINDTLSSQTFHTSKFQNSVLSNNSENCNTSSYVTENLEELKTVYECLNIKFPCDDCTVSPTVHPEACSALNSHPTDCQELPVSNSSFEVSTESCNSNIAIETFYMQQPPNFYQKQMPYLTSTNLFNVQAFTIQPIYNNITASQKRFNYQQIIDGMTKEDLSKFRENGTYLHEAVENNDAYLLEALLKKLDKLQFKQHIINYTNNYQQTALQLAVMKNFPSMVHILIKHGADVNIIAKSSWEDSSKFEAPLHMAASKLKRMLVKELLTAKDIDLDLKNSDGKTALHCAIQAPPSAGTDKTFIISKLIKMNANPSCKDKEQGKNILMYAIEFEDYDVVNVILKTVSWQHITKMITDKSDKGETCLTLVNPLDKDHELFSKRCKLVQTLQDYQEKIENYKMYSHTPVNEKQYVQT